MKLHHRVIPITLALLCLALSICEAKVVYVKTTGLDTNDGLSWDTAKKTVQAGINASASGDEIWVAAGTYVERITLKAATGLYGGFTGTETSRDQRNWKVNVTVLDGNQGGCVVTSPPGATTTTVIDGFTVQNGYTQVFGGGAGIVCSSSSPTITNNAITRNTSGSPGGGIACYSSSALICNNRITDNSGANLGGGIACYEGSPTIINNVIEGNSAPHGGGIACDSPCSGIIANNVIQRNGASTGGGIYCGTSSLPTITNNTITDNVSTDGGGVYLETPTSFVNNIVAFNSSGLRCSGDRPSERTIAYMATRSTTTIRICRREPAISPPTRSLWQ